MQQNTKAARNKPNKRRPSFLGQSDHSMQMDCHLIIYSNNSTYLNFKKITFTTSNYQPRTLQI